jgi:Protein of unknown function (DUF1360)
VRGDAPLLRAPFTTYQGTSGPAELSEEVRGSGARKAVGELVTCPFCTSVWVATGFTAGLIYLPRTTRPTVGTLAALAGADLLQFAHAWLQKASSLPTWWSDPALAAFGRAHRIGLPPVTAIRAPEM